MVIAATARPLMKGLRMRKGPTWLQTGIALGVIAVLTIVSPALGGPSLRSLVKKEVAKQISKATGPAGPNGTNGSNGTNGADGTARAFGRVAENGTLTRSKNATVSHPSTGTYCITLASGIDASQTGLTATPDFAQDSTFLGTNGAQAVVEWDSVPLTCSAGTLEVDTAERTVSTAGSTDGDVRAVNLAFHDESFFFVVP
jgi:hypothetical protein